MSSQVSVGDELVGKVTAIKDYGAFILLPSGRSGLAHISQIAREYVKKAEDYLTVGDDIKVKVISIQGDRIALSIKQVAPLTRKDGRKHTSEAAENEPKQRQREINDTSKRDKTLSLEDKLRKWMKSSEERLQALQSKQKRR